MPKIKAVVAMKQRLQEALGRLSEHEEVLDLVREAVARYELTPADVFSTAELEAAVQTTIVDGSVPYCDRHGNTWSGMGRRPAWLSEAIQAGAALEDFRNPNFRRASRQVEPFCDADGNTWSGRGRRPKWLTEAIDRGADLEDFKNPAHGAS
jgi:DNA-binding protein H-NS